MKAGSTFFSPSARPNRNFLTSLEDFSKGGEPTLETALAIASVRREYFLTVQKGKASAHVISVAKLPSKDATVEGIGWLPRIIPKAEAKLRGEMPPELMYCCGGDRRFFRSQEIDPAEFLRQAWSAQGNPAKLIAWVVEESSRNGPLIAFFTLILF